MPDELPNSEPREVPREDATAALTRRGPSRIGRGVCTVGAICRRMLCFFDRRLRSVLD